MAGLILAWLRFARRRKRMVLSGCLAVFIFCVVMSVRMATREDIRILLPEDASSLAEQFTYLQHAPFLHLVVITVGGAGYDHGQLTDIVAGALPGETFSFVATGPGITFAPAFAAKLCKFMPSLLRTDQIAAFGERLDAQSISAALARDKQILVSPAGFALRELVGKDPLRLHEVFLQGISTMRGLGSIAIRDARFTDSTGTYGMVIARPRAGMNDALASAAAMEEVRKALDKLPSGVETYVSGSYRHSEANAAIIKNDLGRILPASFLLLGLLFVLFLRSRQALVIIAVPVSAFSVAAAVSSHVSGSISGMVLGFGSVVLGVTADYAIHTYYAVTEASDADGGMRRLCPSLAAGATTTAAAFCALALSSIPAIRQMALFGLVGVGSAFCFSLFLLPLALEPRSGVARGAEKRAAGTARLGPAVVSALCFCVVIAIAARFIHLDGDIRNLAYTSSDITYDEERIRAIWGMPEENIFIVTRGDASEAGFEAMLRSNDKVWDILRKAHVTSSCIAPILPSRQRQEHSRATWQALWQKRGGEVLATLRREAAAQGFAPSAFAAFAELIAQEPALVTPDAVCDLGMGFPLDMAIARTDEGSFAYTVLSEKAGLDETVLRDITEAGGRYVSGAEFRNTMAHGVGRDIFRFCLLTLLVVMGAVFMMFRSLARGLVVLSPMLAGLAFSLVLFLVSDSGVTMFHAVALPLVIALSVDYGIFIQAVCEGRMDGAGRKGVLLSALTTLAGFGVLLLAKHPALFSLGVTVTGGIAAAMAAALWLQPLLAAPGCSGNGR